MEPDLVDALRAANADTAQMQHDLVKALGLREA